jgi:hypothetical protein
MGIAHNQLAYVASSQILKQLRTGSAAWAASSTFTSNTVYGVSLADWPRPDATFVDHSTKVGMALEFKPPGQTKREYLTGLGQAVAYLDTFQYAALVVPQRAVDGFAISEFIKRLLSEPFGSQLPVALFEYTSDPGDERDLRALVDLRPRPGAAVKPSSYGRRDMFWAYWRDASQHDVYEILLRIDRSASGTFDQGYQAFWNATLSKGESRTWEGKKRKAYRSSMKQHELNARIGLLHIGLISNEGRLTLAGLRLLQVGKIYEADSLAFKRLLARHLLEEGRHLELMFWVLRAQQHLMRRSAKRSSEKYNRALDVALQNEGIIKHVADGTGKSSFLRDEQKVWNKLGLLEEFKPRRYFHPGEGLRFDWRTITSIVGE